MQKNEGRMREDAAAAAAAAAASDFAHVHRARARLICVRRLVKNEDFSSPLSRHATQWGREG
jgi:hypothetical protein